MSDSNSKIAFDKERAASYDQGNAKLAPLTSALHFLIRTVLYDLPANAHVLCVGVGTGVELMYLAEAFPQWQFTAVEPAAAMLDICRQKVEENGLSSRVRFHEGYLDSLPTADLFDAATCLLVSHFLLKPEDIGQFFSQVALRLRPNGYFINAAIASDQSTADYDNLLEVWLRMLKSCDMPAEHTEKLPELYRKEVAIRPLPEIKSLMMANGFKEPVLFFQTLLIHAWYAQQGFVSTTKS